MLKISTVCQLQHRVIFVSHIEAYQPWWSLLQKWNWEFIQAFWHHFCPTSHFSSYSGYSLRKSKAYCIKKWACLKATATWGTETPTLPHFFVLKIKLNPRLSLTFLPYYENIRISILLCRKWDLFGLYSTSSFLNHIFNAIF